MNKFKFYFRSNLKNRDPSCRQAWHRESVFFPGESILVMSRG